MSDKVNTVGNKDYSYLSPKKRAIPPSWHRSVNFLFTDESEQSPVSSALSLLYTFIISPKKQMAYKNTGKNQLSQSI